MWESIFTRMNPARQSTDELIPLVYERLRHMAGRLWASWQVDASLEPTQLVHETYLRLAAGEPAEGWGGPAHVSAVAAKAMRQILADRARARGRLKRGGGMDRVTLSHLGDHRDPVTVLDLDDALRELEGADPRRAEVLTLRALGGLSVEECAQVLGVSPRTVKADFRVARAWLMVRLSGSSA